MACRSCRSCSLCKSADWLVFYRHVKRHNGMTRPISTWLLSVGFLNADESWHVLLWPWSVCGDLLAAVLEIKMEQEVCSSRGGLKGYKHAARLKCNIHGVHITYLRILPTSRGSRVNRMSTCRDPKRTECLSCTVCVEFSSVLKIS